MNRKFLIRLVLLQLVFILIIITAVPSLLQLVRAQPAVYEDPVSIGWIVIGVSISICVPTVAAAYVLKTTGTAAVSALTERESTFGKALVFVALGEALAIYGLIIAIMLMNYLPAVA